MPLPAAIALALSSLALIFAIGAYLSGTRSFRNARLSKRLTALEIWSVEITDTCDSLLASHKKLYARTATRKRRAEKTNGEMSDEEWKQKMQGQITGKGLIRSTEE